MFYSIVQRLRTKLIKFSHSSLPASAKKKISGKNFNSCHLCLAFKWKNVPCQKSFESREKKFKFNKFLISSVPFGSPQVLWLRNLPLLLYLNMLIFWTLLNIKLANPCLFFGWFLVFSNNYLYNFTTGIWWIIMHLVIWCWDSNSWISSITTGPELPPIPELILYTIAKIKNNVSSPLFMKNPNKNLSEKGTAWSSSHHFGCWCQSY